MVELINHTLGRLLEEKAREYPNNDAVIYPLVHHVRLSYREFNRLCDDVAKGLMAIGIDKGDHVAMWATNHPQWVVAMFACAKIGAVMVTVNTNYKRYEAEYVLKQSDSMTLILIEGFRDSDYLCHIYEMCPELYDAKPGQLRCETLPMLKNVICIPHDPTDRHDGMFAWDDLAALGESVTDAQLRARKDACSRDDVVMMQYTSGTTGFPKGVMLTHYNIVNNGRAIGECQEFSHNDRVLLHVPLFHCFGCVLGVMAAVNFASTMVFLEYFHPVRAMEAIQIEKCTAVYGVPTMFIAMLEHERFREFDFRTLRTGIMAGSPCPVEVMKRVIRDMHVPEITIAFGQTESSPVITMTKPSDPIELRVATIGTVQPHMEVKIVDMETGADAPCNTPGEIVTRGYQVMKGYYKLPEETQKAVDKDGWLHTGDVGTMDENGYFKITGRIKDMIIRGGENIYPREIEEFIFTHPSVQDVQVIGVPDARYGEEVAAYIILKDGAQQIPEQEMIAFVREGLSRFKSPRYVRYVQSFPMTGSGKIQKYKMREMAIEDLGLHSESKIVTA
jgi:fatty-acyl-CoA synthase